MPLNPAVAGAAVAAAVLPRALTLALKRASRKQSQARLDPTKPAPGAIIADLPPIHTLAKGSQRALEALTAGDASREYNQMVFDIGGATGKPRVQLGPPGNRMRST